MAANVIYKRTVSLTDVVALTENVATPLLQAYLDSIKASIDRRIRVAGKNVAVLVVTKNNDKAQQAIVSYGSVAYAGKELDWDSSTRMERLVNNSDGSSVLEVDMATYDFNTSAERYVVVQTSFYVVSGTGGINIYKSDDGVNFTLIKTSTAAETFILKDIFRYLKITCYSDAGSNVNSKLRTLQVFENTDYTEKTEITGSGVVEHSITTTDVHNVIIDADSTIDYKVIEANKVDVAVTRYEVS